MFQNYRYSFCSFSRPLNWVYVSASWIVLLFYSIRYSEALYCHWSRIHSITTIRNDYSIVVVADLLLFLLPSRPLLLLLMLLRRCVMCISFCFSSLVDTFRCFFCRFFFVSTTVCTTSGKRMSEKAHWLNVTYSVFISLLVFFSFNEREKNDEKM